MSGFGNEADALLAYEKVLEIEPGHAGALARKGVILGTRRQYAVSFDLLERSLKIDPTNWNTWYGKGKIWGSKGTDLFAIDRKYDAMKAFETALGAYTKAIELNTTDAALWFEKGVILNKLEKINDALSAFDTSIQLDPLKTNAWYEKGLVLKELGNEANAIKYFKKVLELDPSHTMAKHKIKQS
jgi:tetratricopeptide (TPR) repeat protein